jgi:hypothetical protein
MTTTTTTTIIAPPQDGVELEEYISLFWSVFILDRYASLMCGTACTIRDESVWTPWPRAAGEWDTVSALFFKFFLSFFLVFYLSLSCLAKCVDGIPLLIFLPQPRTDAGATSRTTTKANNAPPPPETHFPLIDMEVPLPRGDVALRAVSVLVLQRAIHLSKAATATAVQGEQLSPRRFRVSCAAWMFFHGERGLSRVLQALFSIIMRITMLCFCFRYFFFGFAPARLRFPLFPASFRDSSSYCRQGFCVASPRFDDPALRGEAGCFSSSPFATRRYDRGCAPDAAHRRFREFRAPSQCAACVVVFADNNNDDDHVS